MDFSPLSRIYSADDPAMNDTRRTGATAMPIFEISGYLSVLESE